MDAVITLLASITPFDAMMPLDIFRQLHAAAAVTPCRLIIADLFLFAFDFSRHA